MLNTCSLYNRLVGLVTCLWVLSTGLSIAQGGNLRGPDALDRMVVSIPSQQVVGHPWVGPASILLLDATGELDTAYDLAAQPIELVSSTGTLSPSILSDPTLLSGGVIDLELAGIIYIGNSGIIDITAVSVADTAESVRVSFSGYQIQDAACLSGDPITEVHTDLPTTIEVWVVNGGELFPDNDPSLKSFFVSGGGSIKSFFTGGANGQVSRERIELPTAGLVPGEDTLILVAESSFDPADSSLSVADTMVIPVTILPTMTAAYVAGSLGPDSVYPGIDCSMEFEVATAGISGPVDSSYVIVQLIDTDDLVVATMFDGPAEYSSFDSDTLTYTGLGARVTSTPEVVPGWYRRRVEVDLFVGSQIVSAVTPAADSILILPGVTADYVLGSLAPAMVASGEETEFQFDLMLSETELLQVDTLRSYFVLSGAGFTSTVTVMSPSGGLQTGLNRLVARRVYVPSQMLGEVLGVQLHLEIHHPGAANRLTYDTDFEGAEIEVEALPVVQITDVTVLSPNAPVVNTDQAFRISCLIANVSSTDMGPFELRLVSNGASVFDSTQTVPGIPGDSTVEVFFNVTASSSSNPSEIFRVDVATFGVNQLPPVDNIVLVTIQRPADLSVSYILRGADSGYVDVGEGFDLLLGLNNAGEATATDGRFRISTNGIYLGLPDSALEVEALIQVGDLRGIAFVAPPFDTVIRIDVTMIERPVDLNTGLVASISDTTFQIELAVTSLDVSLHIGIIDPVSNVVWPGGEKELLRLTAINPGASSVTAIQLEAMSFEFFDTAEEALDVWSIVEVGSTGLYDNNRRVTLATAGGNHLNLTFDEYIIAAGDTVELVLRARTKAESGREFTLSLSPDDVRAVFATGPLQGRAVMAVPLEGDSVIVAEPFTSYTATLPGSFMMRDNPFNPREANAEFRYFLEKTEEVTFLILTLSGELVYERIIPAGQEGARLGENVVFWDGRNDSGGEVLNGVYLAVLTTNFTETRATLKVAVMK